MRTLIVHTQDFSTDFLKEIYADMDSTVVVNFDIFQDELIPLIQMVDRVILLGHGTKHGLLRSDYDGYIVNADLVDELNKKEVIGIWCYASDFAKKNGLKGLFSGMFISEQNEALMEGLELPETLSIEDENKAFAYIMHYHLVNKRDSLEEIAATFKDLAATTDNKLKKYNFSKIEIV